MQELIEQELTKRLKSQTPQWIRELRRLHDFSSLLTTHYYNAYQQFLDGNVSMLELFDVFKQKRK